MPYSELDSMNLSPFCLANSVIARFPWYNKHRSPGVARAALGVLLVKSGTATQNPMFQDPPRQLKFLYRTELRRVDLLKSKAAQRAEILCRAERVTDYADRLKRAAQREHN